MGNKRWLVLVLLAGGVGSGLICSAGWAPAGAAADIPLLATPTAPGIRAEGLTNVTISQLPSQAVGLVTSDPRYVSRGRLPAPARRIPDHAKIPELSVAKQPDPAVAGLASPIGFGGLDDDNNVALTGAPVNPPDPQIAVGPSHVVELVNNTGRIVDKSGTALSTFRLIDFFGVPAGYSPTDPKVIYDALSGRFFATYMSYSDAAHEGRLQFAVSTTSDPTQPWNRSAFDLCWNEARLSGNRSLG